MVWLARLWARVYFVVLGVFTVPLHHGGWPLVRGLGVYQPTQL